MTALLSRLSRSLPLLWLFFAVSTFPSITWGYDAQTSRVTNGYDLRPVSDTDYDSATLLVGNERRAEAPGVNGLFVQIGRSVAAKTGTPKLLAPYTGYQPWAGEIRSVTAASDTTMYRVWGGGSQQAGAWLSPIRPTSAAGATESLALPGANTAQFYSEVLVPAGTRYQIGTAAGANGLTGGGVQVQLLERIPVGNYGPGVPLP